MSGMGRTRWLRGGAARWSLLSVLLCVLLPLAGFAQAPVTPPPLVPVPSTPEESEEGDPYGGYDDEEEEAPRKEEAPRGETFPREPSSSATSDRVTRIIAESLLGLVGEVALGAPGAYLGLILAYSSDDAATGVLQLAVLSFAGVTLGTALGVTGGGALTGGEGRFQMAYVGAALGALAGGLLAFPAAAAGGGAFIVPIIIFPVVGAVLAYEWSHGQELEHKKEEEGMNTVKVVPVLGIRPTGGLVAGLAGRF